MGSERAARGVSRALSLHEDIELEEEDEEEGEEEYQEGEGEGKKKGKPKEKLPENFENEASSYLSGLKLTLPPEFKPAPLGNLLAMFSGSLNTQASDGTGCNKHQFHFFRHGPSGNKVLIVILPKLNRLKRPLEKFRYFYNLHRKKFLPCYSEDWKLPHLSPILQLIDASYLLTKPMQEHMSSKVLIFVIENGKEAIPWTPEEIETFEAQKPKRKSPQKKATKKQPCSPAPAPAPAPASRRPIAAARAPLALVPSPPPPSKPQRVQRAQNVQKAKAQSPKRTRGRPTKQAQEQVRLAVEQAVKDQAAIEQPAKYFVQDDEESLEQTQISEQFREFPGRFMDFSGQFMDFSGQFMDFSGQFMDFSGQFMDFSGQEAAQKPHGESEGPMQLPEETAQKPQPQGEYDELSLIAELFSL